MRTIQITAKCSDMFSAVLRDSGQYVGSYDGYVPKLISNDSDYVELTIDIDTGKIVNWKKPSQQALKIFTP